MRPTTIHIAQPCQENWAAMTSTHAGRHCAACASEVVDFTLKTDAEILAYLAKAAGSRTCGRFAAGQLERPLQRATPATPTTRWRAWLAAAAAVWGLRETAGTESKAQVPMEMRSMSAARTVPELLQAPAKSESIESTAHTLRGEVLDVATNQGFPGVTVLIKGTAIGASTNNDGRFEVCVPKELTCQEVTLVFHSIGYKTEEKVVAVSRETSLITMSLTAEVMGQLGYSIAPPAPWHPRSFYYWGKYWLTRPFHRS